MMRLYFGMLCSTYVRNQGTFYNHILLLESPKRMNVNGSPWLQAKLGHMTEDITSMTPTKVPSPVLKVGGGG